MNPAQPLIKILLLCLLLPGLALADRPSDQNALAGVTSGKIAWDINMGSAEKLLLYLRVIGETYDGLKLQGVEPEMVFTFRGPSVRLISTKRDEVPLDEEEHYDGVAEEIKALLARPNVRMEACSVATRLFGVDGATLVPGVEHVGNTFISQIGYQAKGYATILIM